MDRLLTLLEIRHGSELLDIDTGPNFVVVLLHGRAALGQVPRRLDHAARIGWIAAVSASWARLRVDTMASTVLMRASSSDPAGAVTTGEGPDKGEVETSEAISIDSMVAVTWNSWLLDEAILLPEGERSRATAEGADMSCSCCCFC